MDAPPSIYTTSSLFLRTLARAGITHAFANWGSDHPALLEDLERQRVENGDSQPTIVTCPNEMVALSAAQGFAQATGKPAAVIVHVDVGTQALAGAVHNVDRSRTPVLIYAGASPIGQDAEQKGSRNEWIMWLQDVPDQSAILRQYMRHTSQIGGAKTVEKSVKRALQIATSDPKGPVYLWARREVMEEEVALSALDAVSGMTGWPTIERSALSASATTRIADALLTASSPLIVTSHIGRSPSAVSALASLASLLSIPVISTCPSTVNIPFSHPSYVGVTFLSPDTHWEKLQGVDVILILECDLPWIPGNEKPLEEARVFIVDGSDPLKINIGQWHVDAEIICRADGGVAAKQIETELLRMGVRHPGEKWNLDISIDDNFLEEKAKFRRETLEKSHARLVASLDEAEESTSVLLSRKAVKPGEANAYNCVHFSVSNVIGVLRRVIETLTPSKGVNTLVLNETISNYPAVWSHLRPEVPGNVISSGGSSLGWALGAAVGASLGTRTSGSLNGQDGHDLVVAIVGDGSYMFGVPSSAYWMARRYNTPFLTIVLNNGGWKSPKLSMLGVHPIGHGSKASGDQLSVGFGPDCPDYAEIAVAASAGWAWGARIGGSDASSLGADMGSKLLKDLDDVIKKAVRVVLEERRCAVLDCVLPPI